MFAVSVSQLSKISPLALARCNWPRFWLHTPPPESVQHPQISYFLAELLIQLRSRSGLCHTNSRHKLSQSLMHAADACMSDSHTTAAVMRCSVSLLSTSLVMCGGALSSLILSKQHYCSKEKHSTFENIRSTQAHPCCSRIYCRLMARTTYHCTTSTHRILPSGSYRDETRSDFTHRQPMQGVHHKNHQPRAMFRKFYVCSQVLGMGSTDVTYSRAYTGAACSNTSHARDVAFVVETTATPCSCCSSALAAR